LRLTAEQAWVTRPLRSTRITGLHRYYEAVRPCVPRRYSAPCSFSCLGFSLSRPVRTLPGPPPYRDRRFPRSTREPESGSRRLNAGRRLGSAQRSPRLLPRQGDILGFDVDQVLFDTSSAVHCCSPSRLVPDAFTGAFSAALTTLTVGPAQPAVVWSLLLQGGSGGPTSISRAAPPPASSLLAFGARGARPSSNRA